MTESEENSNNPYLGLDDYLECQMTSCGNKKTKGKRNLKTGRIHYDTYDELIIHICEHMKERDRLPRADEVYHFLGLESSNILSEFDKEMIIDKKTNKEKEPHWKHDIRNRLNQLKDSPKIFDNDKLKAYMDWEGIPNDDYDNIQENHSNLDPKVEDYLSCRYCRKTFNSKRGRTNHELYCPNNPNAVGDSRTSFKNCQNCGHLINLKEDPDHEKNCMIKPSPVDKNFSKIYKNCEKRSNKGDLIKELQDLVKSLREIINNSEGSTNIKVKKNFPEYDYHENFEYVYKDSELPQEIIRQLEKNKHVLLIGPPRTGKTDLLFQIALRFVKKSENILYKQFHPSYSYEDLVECNTPTGPIMKDFRLLCEKALKNLHEPYFFLPDEIDHTNVFSVFGELKVALEYRNQPINTVYYDKPLIVPPNLYVLGACNTVNNIDESIRALFRQIYVQPNLNILRNWFQSIFGEKLKQSQARIVGLLSDLNEHLKTFEYGEDHVIGHCYFMRKEFQNEMTSKELFEEIRDIWVYTIRPILLEKLDHKNPLNNNKLEGLESIYEEFQEKFDN
jgi:hypothetical protein